MSFTHQYVCFKSNKGTNVIICLLYNYSEWMPLTQGQMDDKLNLDCGNDIGVRDKRLWECIISLKCNVSHHGQWWGIWKLQQRLQEHMLSTLINLFRGYTSTRKFMPGQNLGHSLNDKQSYLRRITPFLHTQPNY